MNLPDIISKVDLKSVNIRLEKKLAKPGERQKPSYKTEGDGKQLQLSYAPMVRSGIKLVFIHVKDILKMYYNRI